MKILDIIHSLDAKFQQGDNNYCKYLLKTFEAEEDASRLAAISVGMAKLLKNDLTPDVMLLAERFLSTINKLQSIMEALKSPEDYGGALKSWLYSQVHASSLKELDEALSAFISKYPPKLLGVYKEQILLETNAGYVTYKSLGVSGIKTYRGSLDSFPNLKGLDSIGICFTTSKPNLVACLRRKQYPDSHLYPLIIRKSSKLYNAGIGVKDTVLAEPHLGISPPLLIKRG